MERIAVLLTEPRVAPMLASLAGDFLIVDIDDEAAIARERERIRAIIFAGRNPVPTELIDRFPNLTLRSRPRPVSRASTLTRRARGASR